MGQHRTVTPKLAGKAWQIRIAIPQDCRKHFGRTELKLSKRDLTPMQAQLWANKIGDEFWRSVDRFREGGTDVSCTSVFDVLKQIQVEDRQEYVEASRIGGTTEEMAHTILIDRILDRLRQVGVDPYAEDALAPGAPAKVALSVFNGEAVVYEVMARQWNAQRGVSEKTKDQDMSAILEMTRNIKAVGLVTRQEAYLYADHLRAQSRPKTVKRKISALAGYFDWLINRSYLPDHANPWRNMREITQKSSSEGVNERLPWTNQEAVKLHTEARKSDSVVADAIELAMYTGARIESLFQLRVSDVHGKLLQIGTSGDKTAAGQGRWVPIHSALQPTIDRLVEQTKEPDGYLLQSTANNKYGKRSAAAGKRFGRLKDRVFGEDARHKVFHSFRRTLITALLNEAEAPKHLVSDIIGHADSNVTTGLYRSQAGAKELRKYLELVTYPSS